MESEREVSPTSPTRPTFQRGRRYSTGGSSIHKKRETASSPIVEWFSNPTREAWMEELFQDGPGDTGYPDIVAQRRRYGETTEDNYHLIRKIHHRHSPVGYNLRPLSSKENKRIVRETAEELKKALGQIIAHEECQRNDCDHVFRGRSDTDPEKYNFKPEDYPFEISGKVYKSIDNAVRVEIEQAPRLFYGVREDILSPELPSEEINWSILDSEQAYNELATPAWVMTPALSWCNPDSTSESMLNSSAVSPTENEAYTSPLSTGFLYRRTRARTIDSTLEIATRSRQRSIPAKVPKETDGIKAMRLLQQQYAKKHQDWIMGCLDDPVQVWVDEWGHSPSGLTGMDCENSVTEFVKLTEALGEVATNMTAIQGRTTTRKRDHSLSNINFLTEESRMAADVLLTD
jgi:hypothetical protein